MSLAQDDLVKLKRYAAVEVILSNWADFEPDFERDSRTMREIDRVVNAEWYENEGMFIDMPRKKED